MILGLSAKVWREINGWKPGFLSKTPHFNFITFHYFWIIGMTIVTSILIYPVLNMEYIDALFFASGSCTQAGLNTIDVNLLTTYQQLILFFIPMLTNPITINTFVVFLRLYWFEKRFQHIATEARRNRRTISKTRSQMKSERDIGQEEAGVNGRRIVVMHDRTQRNDMTDGAIERDLDGIHIAKPDPAADIASQVTPGNSDESSKSESAATDDHQDISQPAVHQPQIKFASRVMRSDGASDEPLRRLSQWTEQDHIAVLERQRNPQDGGVLRIPGPRDADRGVAPEALVGEEETNHSMARRSSHPVSRRGSISEIPSTVPQDQDLNQELGLRPAVTIQEPQRRVSHIAGERVRAAAHTLGIFKIRKPRILTGKKNHEDKHHQIPGTRTRRNSFSSFKISASGERSEPTPYLSWQPTIGRNSAFVDLTEPQREELGGIEYRSLKSLALILVLYFWGFLLFGLVGLLPWILEMEAWGSVLEGDGINKVWWAFFSANTAFNDVGFTLTPDSMNSFNTAIWPLLLMSFLVVIGNTGFPIMLRFIIWVTSKYIPAGSGFWEELKFLLDHPRRCFTLLFPSRATWWLFGILVILNGIDLIFFIILDLGNTIVTQLPLNLRFLDGWFQAVSTRTAGLSCVNLSLLHPAIQVSYMIMMYISVLPIAISVRRTNVYEEKSLGIYGSHEEDKNDEAEPSYVGTHLRRQLSFDLWYIFLGFFIVAISEGPRIQSGDPNFTMFAVLFEIVSAYGTVGLSLGYPTINASFSAEWGVIGKLVIIAMQIRGRHRGLPYELDRAILLPSESMHEKEDADAASRLRRRNSLGATQGTSSGLDLSSSGTSQPSRRVRSHGKHQPSFLSRIMHPGPAAPREHLAGRLSQFASGEEAVMSPASGSHHEESRPVEGKVVSV